MSLKFIQNCWDIMDCENPDCLARHEPEVSCWELAQRNEAYHDFSNTCEDCIVYILFENKSALSIKQLQDIKKQRAALSKNGRGHQVCIKKPPMMPQNMNRNNYHFLLHDFIERKVFIENTWCESCGEADLAVFSHNEYEIDGSKFTLGYCRKCKTKIMSEIVEKDVDNQYSSQH